MTDKLARGIWPALVTPFTDDGNGVATDRVDPLIRHLLDAGAQGFFVCGGTGEGVAMTVDERKAMTEATVASVAGAPSSAAAKARASRQNDLWRLL